jgi:imidazolonepropionase-like amidohydrolase
VGTIQDSACGALGPNRSLRQRIVAGELAGPRVRQAVLVAPEGGALSPARGLLQMLTQAAAGIPSRPYDSPDSGILCLPADSPPACVRAAVDRAIDERGAELIKLYDQDELAPTYRPGAVCFSLAQLEAAADQARRRGVASAMHHTSVAGFRRGVAAGVHGLVHLPLDALLTEADVRACHSAGTYIQPTVALAFFYVWAGPAAGAGDGVGGESRQRAVAMERLEAWRRERLLRFAAEEWLPELAPLVARSLANAAAGRQRAAGQDLGRVFRYWARIWGAGRENLALLAAGGAKERLGCGTDWGPAWCGPALLDLEIALLGLALADGPGFTPGEALRAATGGGAAAIGLADEIGAIEPGKVADLAVLEGDALIDPGVLGRPVAAMMQGGRLVVDRIGLEA